MVVVWKAAYVIANCVKIMPSLLACILLIGGGHHGVAIDGSHRRRSVSSSEVRLDAAGPSCSMSPEPDLSCCLTLPTSESPGGGDERIKWLAADVARRWQGPAGSPPSDGHWWSTCGQQAATRGVDVLCDGVMLCK